MRLKHLAKIISKLQILNQEKSHSLLKMKNMRMVQTQQKKMKKIIFQRQINIF
jgi:hypothetical protein